MHGSELVRDYFNTFDFPKSLWVKHFGEHGDPKDRLIQFSVPLAEAERFVADVRASLDSPDVLLVGLKLLTIVDMQSSRLLTG